MNGEKCDAIIEKYFCFQFINQVFVRLYTSLKAPRNLGPLTPPAATFLRFCTDHEQQVFLRFIIRQITALVPLVAP